ncbi:M23 family metallopeptidase, partial [Lysobacter sp. 2RAB21]
AETARVSLNPKHDFDEAAGNYVVLALADGRYATYEHLRPGSVKLREGDKVRIGQTIGELGFTGDSTGPHLHFHLADGRKPLASEGVGYGFAGFRLLGHYPQLDRLGKQPWQALEAGIAPERRGELPASNAVVEFPR